MAIRAFTFQFANDKAAHRGVDCAYQRDARVFVLLAQTRRSKRARKCICVYRFTNEQTTASNSAKRSRASEHRRIIAKNGTTIASTRSDVLFAIHFILLSDKNRRLLAIAKGGGVENANCQSASISK